VAAEALVGIVPRAEPVRIGSELRKGRIELAASRDGRALRHHRAFVARRFELTRAQDALLEGGEFVDGDGRARRRMRTDDGRRWNRNAAVLKHAGGILIPAADSRILLCKRWNRRKAQSHERARSAQLQGCHVMSPPGRPDPRSSFRFRGCMASEIRVQGALSTTRDR